MKEHRIFRIEAFDGKIYFESTCVTGLELNLTIQPLISINYVETEDLKYVMGNPGFKCTAKQAHELADWIKANVR
jgi:hypothetical protein